VRGRGVILRLGWPGSNSSDGLSFEMHSIIILSLQQFLKAYFEMISLFHDRVGRPHRSTVEGSRQVVRGGGAEGRHQPSQQEVGEGADR
jgi:hypothetical protein